MNQLNYNLNSQQLVVPTHQAVLAHSRGPNHPGYANYQVHSPTDISGRTKQSYDKHIEENQSFISFLKKINKTFYYFKIYEH